MGAKGRSVTRAAIEQAHAEREHTRKVNDALCAELRRSHERADAVIERLRARAPVQGLRLVRK